MTCHFYGVVALTWPRISPFGFLFVSTFAYTPPCNMALRNVGVATYGPVYEPCAPTRQGPQSGIATGPALPTTPKCRRAAIAWPLRLLKLNCQTNVLFLPATVSLAVK